MPGVSPEGITKIPDQVHEFLLLQINSRDVRDPPELGSVQSTKSEPELGRSDSLGWSYLEIFLSITVCSGNISTIVLLYCGFIHIPRRIASDIFPLLIQSPEYAVCLAVIPLFQRMEKLPGLLDGALAL